jgi:AraC-like DNA-binding protein
MQQLANDIYERVVTAKMFMDDNFHEQLDLEQISQQAFFSRFHFHRLFTRIYRKTPTSILQS